MFQPTEFLDGENIIIINDIPYFRYTGVTYKDKLKNGLPLEYVFYMEDSVQNSVEEVKKMKEKIVPKYYKEEKYYEEEDNKEYNELYVVRKGKKWSPKKRQAKNIKKNKIRQTGYTYKLFAIEQELPDVVDVFDLDYNVHHNCHFDTIVDRLQRCDFVKLCWCKVCCDAYEAYTNYMDNPCGSFEKICNCDICRNGYDDINFHWLYDNDNGYDDDIAFHWLYDNDNDSDSDFNTGFNLLYNNYNDPDFDMGFDLLYNNNN